MKAKTFWSVTSLLMVGVLVLLSCGPQAAPTPAPRPVPTPAAPTPSAPAPTPSVPAPAPAVTEKPRYGGTINIVEASETGVWDNSVIPQGTGRATELVYESLVTFDWQQAREGKVNWAGGIVGEVENWGPQLAESWKAPTVGTWIIQIRRGVHFGLNPQSEASRLMNGREMTADDVVWNVRRMTTVATSTTVVSNPLMSKALTIEKTGPWEVTIKAPVEPLTAWWWVIYGGNAQHIWPREVVEKYGGAQDWRVAVGTGPFMVTDYIPASVTTLTKNPGYWDKDPIGPGKGNQLPYVDTFKFFIIPDISTRLASIRTGRADWTTGIPSEDSKSLINSNPKLKYTRFLGTAILINMKMNKTELPFKDKRVRQALTMAIDYQSLKRDLYGNEAEIMVFPVPPTFPEMYMAMDKLPETTRALYQHNPEKAKQLLAEAGYPNGFKTKLIVQNVAVDMDPAAAYKAMWAKIGVEVELQPRETAVHASISRAGSWEEMIMGGSGSASAANMLAIYTFSGIKSTKAGAAATQTIDDTKIDATYAEVQKHIVVNFPEARRLIRELTPYVLEQAYRIPLPAPYSFTLWQPWLKNHYGEYRPKIWARYAWIDQDLKEQMTGRR